MVFVKDGTSMKKQIIKKEKAKVYIEIDDILPFHFQGCMQKRKLLTVPIVAQDPERNHEGSI